MEKQKNHKIQILQSILGVLMTISFLLFAMGEIFLPAENIFEDNTCRIFQSEWVQMMSDGAEVPIKVPGVCDADFNQWVTIATTLPQKQQDTWFCIRSMQQELNIYVGDELRKEYSTLGTQLFGKTSTMTYVFFPIYKSDAGEELRIELKTDSSYAGYVSEIYEGEKTDIINHFYEMYAPATIVAAFMLLIGAFVVAACVFVRIFYKRKMEVIHLGNVILIASSWLLVESKLRQFIFPNSTMAMWMGFLLIAILPYPFFSYINSIQQRRYEKAFMVLGVATAVNYVIVVMLQIMNIKDFFETMTASHIVIIFLITLMAVTIGLDIWKGYVKEYREVAVGFAALMMAGVFEIGLTYIEEAQSNGIALCVGLVVLLFTAGLKTIRDLLNTEKEKQMAIAASESKAKFLANMSHEIRTPINTVIGMNEMILRENEDKKIEEYAFNIKNASEMLLSLINDVLDFSKIEAGKLQLNEHDYHLADMLYDVILGIEFRAKQKNLELKLEIDEAMPAVLKGDDIRMKQILNNLLSNAIKYTAKGSITLCVNGIRSKDGFYLFMSVTDTGMGVKKEDMEKMFADFQRLELSKNRYIEGTGLGLNITKQLVNCMNGTIEVKSEYGAGSCFSVKIPQQIVTDVAMGKIGAHSRKNESEKKSIQDALYAPDAKILVVDDTRMNLIVIKELLKRSQVQLEFATGGKECLQMTRERKYDLILMDHMMPEPDGVQTLHAIMNDKDNLNQETKVIVMTANAIAGMKEQYIAEGFADYLSKPVEVEKLEEMLGKYLK